MINPRKHARTLTRDEWWAEARARFGDDPMAWRFVCPSCKHVASLRDWKEAGAAEGEWAFSCVGRRLTGSAEAFKGQGGPCNYAGGGLFRLNPVTVTWTEEQPSGHDDTPDGKPTVSTHHTRDTFEFAEAAS